MMMNEMIDAGDGVPIARSKLYSDEKFISIVSLCLEYCELGLRGLDTSHEIKINFARQFFI